MEAVVAPVRGLPLAGTAGAGFFTGFLLVLTTNPNRIDAKTALVVGDSD